MSAIHQLFTALAAPTPPNEVEWRPDGRPAVRGDRLLQRYVAYVSAHFVRQRLDDVCAAHGATWTTALAPLPQQPEIKVTDDRGREKIVTPVQAAFQCTISIRSPIEDEVGFFVTRADVGTGDDYKSAATDAFKRAGVRCGIASDLYDYGQNWVPVDNSGRALEEPGVVYQKRLAQLRARSGTGSSGTRATASAAAPIPSGAVAVRDTPLPASKGNGASAPSADSAQAPAYAPVAEISRTGLKCAQCGGDQFYDNRAKKTAGIYKASAPDFKCKQCGKGIWPDDEGYPGVARVAVSDMERANGWADRLQQNQRAMQANQRAVTAAPTAEPEEQPDLDGFPPALVDGDDDLPF